MALAAIQMRMLIARNRKGLSICPRINNILNGHNTNTSNKSTSISAGASSSNSSHQAMGFSHNSSFWAKTK